MSNKPHKNKKYEEKEASYRAKVSNYKAHAKIRNIEWNLTYNEASILLKSNCHYCTGLPSNTYNVLTQNRCIKNLERINLGIIKYNGIDRLDNTKGYVPGNVVSCCTICNSAKNILSLDDFKKWINKVYENLCNF